VLGLCGAQGSGKSTLAAALAERFERAAILSIDDLYRTKAERTEMARAIHPLFATRGAPGTHDVALGLATLDALDRGERAALPRFDKSRDDRAPASQWGHAPADTRLLIFEGWCVGARPQAEAALAAPINALEREEDAHGLWRRAANAALAGDYQRLFARIDRLILLAAPGFEVVRGWRIEQEQALRAQAAPDAPGLMSDAEVARFIQHYERITRHILIEMPARADFVARLAADRSLLSPQGL
jgi:D-glycerate 3-kinase